MKEIYILLLAILFIGFSAYGQQSFLVRQTLSSNGTSQKLQSSSKYVLVQQSIGQSSVIGSGQTEHVSFREGFIQAPLGTSLLVRPKALQISSYPNPFSNEVIIDFSREELKSATIIIRDFIGREVLSIYKDLNDDSPVIQLDTSLLSSGSYFLQVHSDSGAFTTKLIKQ